MSTNPLLKVKDLQVHFDTDDGVLHAVDGVNFHIDRSETLGVVGESCLLYTSPSPRDLSTSRMPSSA